MGLLTRLRERWRQWSEARRLARDIDPAVFLAMAGELREIALAASKLWQDDPSFSARARRILEEMDQLERIAQRPEFRRLSPQKRLELRRSLILSRDQLLETMQASPPPTTTIQ
ncbi:hypothetical protein [Desulfocurvus sp.]|jgi:hypothetical protein|uniref:hypothetical protein n=1 Tax=Desulfocurvus sp. TaxID=2871698 RepID=UPI0025C4A304|nr:hypothetical protein [Desulfocurvus sp.]MCK9240782.1 hypothetical protein [Desulfocurvus sp.]